MLTIIHIQPSERTERNPRTSTLRCSFRTLIACPTNPIALGRSAFESRDRRIVQMARSHLENFSNDNALCSRLAWRIDCGSTKWGFNDGALTCVIPRTWAHL